MTATCVASRPDWRSRPHLASRLCPIAPRIGRRRPVDRVSAVNVEIFTVTRRRGRGFSAIAPDRVDTMANGITARTHCGPVVAPRRPTTATFGGVNNAGRPYIARRPVKEYQRQRTEIGHRCDTFIVGTRSRFPVGHTDQVIQSNESVIAYTHLSPDRSRIPGILYAIILSNLRQSHAHTRTHSHTHTHEQSHSPPPPSS